MGARKTALETVDCVAARLYQADQFIDERHRHRYEVNPTLVPALEKAGLRFVGKDETGERMEIVELDANPVTRAIQRGFLSRISSDSLNYINNNNSHRHRKRKRR